MSYITKPSSKKRSTITCPQCNNTFLSLGRHLQHCNGTNNSNNPNSTPTCKKIAINDDETFLKRTQQYASTLQSNTLSGIVQTRSGISSTPTIHNKYSAMSNVMAPEIAFLEDNTYNEQHSSDSETSLIHNDPNLNSKNTQNDHWANSLFSSETPSNTNDDLHTETTVLEVDKYSHLCTKKSVEMSPLIWYQVHLEHVLHEHRNVSNCLQDKINAVTKLHCEKGLDLSQATCYSRKQLLNILAKAYNLIQLKPSIVNVPLTNPALFAAVAVFDLKASILDILHDEKLMLDNNFAPGLDVFSGKCTQPITHIGEVHTGYAYEKARKFYCTNESTDFPLPMISFYDETHGDNHGCLTCIPFLWWPGFFKKEMRHQFKCVRVLGYVPNLKYGKGTNNRQSTMSKMQEEHNCLRSIIVQLKHIVEEGGIPTTVMNKNVTVKPWLHLCCGDTAGLNKLCGRKATHEAYRECLCPFDRLGSKNPPCIQNPHEYLLTTRKIYTQSKTPNGLDALNLRPIQNAMTDIPLCDPVYGINHQCPGEMLHAHGNGIIEYQINIFVQMVGPKTSNKQLKNEIDMLHQNMVLDSMRQSERDEPRKSHRAGLCDGTKVTAMERLGNIHELLVMSYTTTGHDLIVPILHKHRVSLRKWRDCIKLQLSFDKWVHDHNPINDVQHAQPIVSKMIGRIKECFPRNTGNGWNLPKMHILSRMIPNMLRFGAAEVFSGQHGERFLMSAVKDVVTNTRKQAGSYAQEIASRVWERGIVNTAYHRGVEPYLNEKVDMTSPKVDIVSGEFTLSCALLNARGQGQYIVKWKNPNRQKYHIPINSLFQLGIGRYLVGQGCCFNFSVKGYTTYHKTFGDNDKATIFQANSRYYGKERYDWCLVQFDGDDDPENLIYASKILGFVEFDKGLPTPHLVEEMNHSPTHIMTHQLIDETKYVVIHTTKTFLNPNTLIDEFVSEVELGDPLTHIYVVNVECILDPLNVSINWGGCGNKHFVRLPYRHWGKHFTQRIHANMQDEGIHVNMQYEAII